MNAPTVRMSSRWVEHLADTDRDGLMSCGRVPPRVKSAQIRAEPFACECNLGVRHTHCAGCGRLVSKGDWDAPPIAEFTIRFDAPTKAQRKL